VTAVPYEQLFLIVSLAPLPFWALMLFAPGWSVSRRVMESFIGPGLFAAIYAAGILPLLPHVLPGLFQLPDLHAIKAAFAIDDVLFVAWVHYLSFDLFVGRWEYLDARERGVPHWLLAPCLLLTLYFGPLGLLLYLGARLLAARGSGK
jgi:hypothetical protein